MNDDLLTAVTHLADFVAVGAFGVMSAPVAALRRSSRGAGMWPACRPFDTMGDRYEQALVNGMAAHALDWDDVMLGVPNHPGTVIWPALLSTAPVGSTVRDLAEAFLEGIGMAAELSDALGAEHYEQGWHATATIGRMAAAYAAAFASRRESSLGWAAMQLAAVGASGVSDVFGTSVKPVQVGMAAAGAAQAALMVELLDDVPDVLLPDSKLGRILGVRRAPNRAERYTSEAATRALRIKTHPMCYFAHAPVHAARDAGLASLPATHSITVTVNPTAARICKVARPRTIEEARFSLPYLVAATGLPWNDGALGLLDGEILVSAEVAASAQRVRIEVDPRFNDMEATVEAGGDTLHLDLESSSQNSSRQSVAEKARHSRVREFIAPALQDFLESTADPDPGVLDASISELFTPLPQPSKETKENSQWSP